MQAAKAVDANCFVTREIHGTRIRIRDIDPRRLSISCPAIWFITASACLAQQKAGAAPTMTAPWIAAV